MKVRNDLIIGIVTVLTIFSVVYYTSTEAVSVDTDNTGNVYSESIEPIEVEDFISKLIPNNPINDLESQPEVIVVDLDDFDRTIHFTGEQEELLRIAKEEGDLIGWPETVQAILLQETTAGLNGPVGDHSMGFGKRSYCHMQVKLTTARYVLRFYDDMGVYRTDEELLVKLLTDDQFCIRMGARYFEILTRFTDNWSHAVLAYNRGLTGSRSGHDPVDYVNGIRDNIHNKIRPYQEELGQLNTLLTQD